MDIANFRVVFPEFSDTTAYPASQITFWSTIAEAQVVEDNWGDIYAQAVMLYTAHEIVIARQNAAAGTIGGTPGVSGGIANSKTVGSVTVSYDANTQTEKDAGWWNRTTYGQQFFRLMKLYGAGCIQL